LLEKFLGDVPVFEIITPTGAFENFGPMSESICYRGRLFRANRKSEIKIRNQKQTTKNLQNQWWISGAEEMWNFPEE
jgi:hypothetical protein